jgi:hypothetical protein
MQADAREWGQVLGQALRLLEKKQPFDESQHPRDEHGRWTDSSGGAIDIEKVEAKTKANVTAASALARARGHKPLPGSKGDHPAIIASRNPTAKGSKKNPAPPPAYGQPDVVSMKLEPARYEHDIGLFKNDDFYPNFRAADFSGSTDEATATIVAQMKDNLKFLYQYADKHTQVWYDGARALVDDRVKLYGFNDASVAAVYAALSPTKDWDQNVHIADMLMQTYKNQQNTRWSDAMNEKSKTLWSKANQKVVDLVRGKTLGELTTPAEKALWIRTYDETHNKAEYRTVLPNGAMGEVMRNKDGTPSKVVWQSLPSISNAIKALEANGDRDIISAAMGTAHKVRSFYNNILDPHSANGDVTIDTHAVGAALLRQLSSSSVAVSHNFGNTPMKVDQPVGWEAAGASIKTGLSGLYPVYAQAYREAANELGIQPRQLQSAVWVVKRNTFGNASKKTQDAIEAAWHDYHDNPKVTLADTQRAIAKLIGLEKNERHYRLDEEGRRAGDARELHRNGVGPAAASMDGRAGDGAARRAAGLDDVRGAQRGAGAEGLTNKLFDESEHPRDSHGRWTDSGGGDDHPGQGYSKDARLIDGVIHTDNVYDAARALHENRRVELTQPRSASVLIDKLGEISKSMIEKGEQAPTFDLCKVTLKGTSLFCADSQGIPRVQMPQLTIEQDKPFFKYLQAKGYKVVQEEQYASYLRATQNELNGAKVAGIAAAMRSTVGYHSSSNPIFVSNDDYILDGHHRWAAEIGVDATDNVLANDKKMAIWRVDIPITKLLEEAETFTGGEGKLSLADEAATSGTKADMESRYGKPSADWKATASGLNTKGEQRLEKDGNFIRRNFDTGKYLSPIAKLENDLPYYSEYVRTDADHSHWWNFMTTPKGIAETNLMLVFGADKPTLEIMVVRSVDRGSGRAALEMIIEAADTHGVRLQLDPVPLDPPEGGEGVKMSKEKLEAFYAGFGFKQEGERDEGGKGTITMVREPKPDRKKAWEQERARALAWLGKKEPFDESQHPRDEDGKFTDGGGAPAKITKASIKANMKSAYEVAQKESRWMAQARITENGQTYPKAFVMESGFLSETGPNGKSPSYDEKEFAAKFGVNLKSKSEFRTYRHTEAKKLFEETGHYGPWDIDASIEAAPEKQAKLDADAAKREKEREDFKARWEAAQEKDRPRREAEAKKEAEAKAKKEKEDAERKARTPEIDHSDQPAVMYGMHFNENELAQKFYKNREEYLRAGVSVARYKLADMPGDAYSVNRALRGQESMTPEIQKYIDGIDLAFERTGISLLGADGKPKTESWVYRSIGVKNEGQYKKGLVVQDNGFISTSTSPSFAEQWGFVRDKDGDVIKEADGLVVKITVPKSVKVMPIVNLGTSDAADEREILLPRGTKFLITKVKGRYIDMTVIP